MLIFYICLNILDLLRGNVVVFFLLDDELFELYDLVFKNNYFGVM